jgi:hypothetical protein
MLTCLAFRLAKKLAGPPPLPHACCPKAFLRAFESRLETLANRLVRLAVQHRRLKKMGIFALALVAPARAMGRATAKERPLKPANLF